MALTQHATVAPEGPRPIDGLQRVTLALRQLGVRHLVCGSLASSMHGEPRTTHDFDLVADLGPEHVAPLVAALQTDFYCDAELIRLALRQRISFNLVHLTSGQKIDVFLLRDREFSRMELARASTSEVSGVQLPFASAEDTLLTKLEWFRKGGEQSERQWRDALGIVKVQAAQLDRAYVDRWAQELGVADLWQRVQVEAGLA